MRAWLLVIVAACGSEASGPLDVSGGGALVTRPPALEGQLFAPPVTDALAISSTFGPRWKTSANRYDFHPGIDYFGALDTPVYAIGPGIVDGVYPDGSTTYPNGGNVVVVRHALASPRMFHGIAVDRVYAVYLHLNSFVVAEGDTVTTGQQVGAMGMTGDTDFIHLHFEIRVQTTCSLPYQLDHPSSSCALGFDPHVHPYLFVGGDNADQITVTALPTPNAFRYTATRGDLDLDVIETDAGALGFSARDGIDASSLTTLDSFDYGWLRLDPQPFTSTSDQIVYDLYFKDAPAFLEVRDIHGTGLRFGP